MDLQQLKSEALREINGAGSLEQLRELEIKYLGRKGALTEVLRELGSLPQEKRGEMGSQANQLKREIELAILGTKKVLGQKEFGEIGEKEWLDPTAEKPGRELGHLHPISIVQHELEDFFSSMGFMVLDGPELESDYYNFEALNIPPHHPARDMQDTFYVDILNNRGEYDMVMRTQTSSVQVRAMQKYGAPLRCIVPGRCFRSEATDVRHEHTFYQLEGLMIDKDINLANMKAVLEALAKFLYGEETKLRLRPKYYPFVEPGTNGEVTCFLCHGRGCRLCKNTGWLEIFGSGLVHPNVLRAGGIDPKKYSGFAFGLGLNRIVQLKYGIEDIRLFMGGDQMFLKQF